MKRRIMFLIVFQIIFLFHLLSASCEENQIDINTASAEELDQLSGIGLAKAESIISSRPFNSLDDLLDVSGIGEATLQQIKSQGLACVEEEISPSQDEESIDSNSESSLEEDEIKIIKETISPTVENLENINQTKVIKLTGKSIKTLENSDETTENKNKTYAVYGLIAFCIVLLFLFLAKYKIDKGKNKNEFR